MHRIVARSTARRSPPFTSEPSPLRACRADRAAGLRIAEHFELTRSPMPSCGPVRGADGVFGRSSRRCSAAARISRAAVVSSTDDVLRHAELHGAARRRSRTAMPDTASASTIDSIDGGDLPVPRNRRDEAVGPRTSGGSTRVTWRDRLRPALPAARANGPAAAEEGHDLQAVAGRQHGRRVLGARHQLLLLRFDGDLRRPWPTGRSDEVGDGAALGTWRASPLTKISIAFMCRAAATAAPSGIPDSDA